MKAITLVAALASASVCLYTIVMFGFAPGGADPDMDPFDTKSSNLVPMAVSNSDANIEPTSRSVVTSELDEASLLRHELSQAINRSVEMPLAVQPLAIDVGDDDRQTCRFRAQSLDGLSAASYQIVSPPSCERLVVKVLHPSVAWSSRIDSCTPRNLLLDAVADETEVSFRFDLLSDGVSSSGSHNYKDVLMSDDTAGSVGVRPMARARVVGACSTAEDQIVLFTIAGAVEE